MYGIVLIIVLVITGGAIAFIGDRLGTKVGKKKLSIFGLRPRHTSIIVTIITGILITTLTFGIMAAVSKDVRTALFGMEKLNQQIKETQTNLTVVTDELAAANLEQENTNKDLAKTKNEVSSLKTIQVELESRNTALESNNRNLEAGNAQLVLHNDDLMAQNSALGDQNTSLMQANSSLNEENNILAVRSAEFRQGLQFVRQGDIIYRAGEIIASGVVDVANNDKTINADLTSLVYLANRNITQRMGAKSPIEGVWISQKEFDEAFNTIKNARQNTVIRIVAAGNIVYGEPVRANIQIYKNSLIYHENDYVFAEKFSVKGQSADEAERTVIEFLKHVNISAIKKGILSDPIKGSVGVMTGSQFYDIINSIDPIRGDILLTAYAQSDTNALGPLKLRIKVEEILGQK
ncbi:Uncharacterized conserved protein, contains DUF3084 domain [Propionispira arboris]|uniref:Uncharacterized conserved protein, contains DUF3084 domain n=1 Tax=Propionispira arboris TaxID=84035 RepID=A0A1H6TT86_9FIRM|nr:DUF3084 domain-containing protein [Propionispira arboris]SEI83279.1 Uncharacterized conserved protein, contains DUF3084 domain [Propionispira arboris]